MANNGASGYTPGYLVIWLTEVAEGRAKTTCYFCDGALETDQKQSMRIQTRWRTCVHHINHNHNDDTPANLAGAHLTCHSKYHPQCVPCKSNPFTLEELHKFAAVRRRTSEIKLIRLKPVHTKELVVKPVPADSVARKDGPRYPDMPWLKSGYPDHPKNLRRARARKK